MSLEVLTQGGVGGPSASIFVTGLSETDTVTAVHKKTVQVPNPDYVVPDGYTQLEYIESTGTQYIDSGISVNSTDLTVECDGTSLGDGFTLFGAGGTYGFEVLPAPDNSFTRFNYYTSQIDISGGPCDGVFKMDRNMCYINGSLVHTFSSTSWSVDNIWLFGRNRYGALDNSGISTIRYCKIWVADVLVRHFVPCKNGEGAFGLYDLVNDVFYTNAGSGTFTAGSEIPTYIETVVEDKTLNGKWIKRIFKNNDVALIPKMTSDTEPSGTATVSKVDSADAGYAYKAFDQDSVTYAYGGNGSIPWTLQYEFPGIVLAKTISFKVAQPSSDGSRTATFNVQVLSDDIWQTVYSGTTTKSTGSSETQTVALEEPKNITAVKIVNTAMTGSGAPSICVMDFQVYGDVETTVGGFEIKPIRDFGTWTVTATDGVHTKTQDVLVDVITEYEIEMDYKLWLYRDGDECEDVTGGWSSSEYTSASTLQEPTKNSDSVTLYCNTNNYASFIGTVNPISFAGYTKLKCCTKNVSISGTYAGGTIHFDAQKTASASSGQYVSFVRSSNESECETDITHFQGVYYVCANVFNATSKADLTKVWLE